MKRSGRRHMMNCLALAGNGTGAAGFATAKAVEAADAIEKAVARAPKELIPIERKTPSSSSSSSSSFLI